MVKKPKLTKREKDLIRRYLIWCYKTTKEELDKIDRYFTQLKADAYVLLNLRKTKEYKASAGNSAYKDIVDGFQAYMSEKEINVLKKKYKNGQSAELDPGYQYLENRFIAIENTIEHFLGVNELKNICRLYEEEMTDRILKAREHT